MHLDGPSFYISPEEDIFLMIPTAEYLVENDHMLARSHTDAGYICRRLLLDGLRALYLKKNEEKCPIFALFVDKKSQQAKITSHSIMLLFISICVLSTMMQGSNRKNEKPKMSCAKGNFC